MQSTYKYRFDHSTIYWTLIYIIVFVLLARTGSQTSLGG